MREVGEILGVTKEIEDYEPSDKQDSFMFSRELLTYKTKSMF